MSSATRLIVNSILVCFTGGLLSLWMFSTYKSFKRENELCKNGQPTIGYVYSLKEESNNEANIHSWEISYRFEGIGRSYWGKFSESINTKIKVGDTVHIIYSKANPNDHKASLSEFKNECYDPSFTSFMKENKMILAIGIIGVLLISLFMIRTEKSSDTSSSEN